MDGLPSIMPLQHATEQLAYAAETVGGHDPRLHHRPDPVTELRIVRPAGLALGDSHLIGGALLSSEHLTPRLHIPTEAANGIDGQRYFVEDSTVASLARIRQRCLARPVPVGLQRLHLLFSCNGLWRLRRPVPSAPVIRYSQRCWNPLTRLE